MKGHLRLRRKGVWLFLWLQETKQKTLEELDQVMFFLNQEGAG